MLPYVYFTRSRMIDVFNHINEFRLSFGHIGFNFFLKCCGILFLEYSY